MPKSATLLVIRHGEKSGKPDDDGLTPAGQARAQAYVAYFRTLSIEGARIATPAWLIAAADSEDSKRSRLTLEPLAAALGLPIDASLDEEQLEALAQRLRDPRYDGATTLICWHHKQLPALVHALGAPPSTLPGPWPDEVFGWIVRLDYDANGMLTNAQVCNQKLMFGDCAASR